MRVVCLFNYNKIMISCLLSCATFIATPIGIRTWTSKLSISQVLEKKIQEKAMSKEKYIPEGLSCTKPQFFNGNIYYFWKGKMDLFLRSYDADMW